MAHKGPFSCMLKTMDDDLTDDASAATVLAWFSQNIPVSAPEN